jgi:hypothetical protein
MVMEKNIIPKKIDNYEKIEMSDGTVIYKNKFVHTLNSTGMEIFELCDNKLSVQEIIEKMKTRYSDVDIDSVVEEFIIELNNNGLITL